MIEFREISFEEMTEMLRDGDIESVYYQSGHSLFKSTSEHFNLKTLNEVRWFKRVVVE